MSYIPNKNINNGSRIPPDVLFKKLTGDLANVEKRLIKLQAITKRTKNIDRLTANSAWGIATLKRQISNLQGLSPEYERQRIAFSQQHPQIETSVATYAQITPYNEPERVATHAHNLPPSFNEMEVSQGNAFTGAADAVAQWIFDMVRQGFLTQNDAAKIHRVRGQK